jgi:general secretion pathway protein B
MSLILDALSRAERDRRREEGSAPDLLDDHGPVVRSSAPRLSRPLLGAVVLLVIAGLAVWLVTRAGPGNREAPAGAARTEPSDAALSPAPAAEPPGSQIAASGAMPRRRGESPPATASGAYDPPQPLAAPPGEPISRAEIARLYEQRDSAQADAPDGAGASVVDAPPARARATDAEPAPAEPGPEAGERAAARVEEPIDLERVLRQARAEVAAAALSDHPAPLLQTLTKQYRDRVPTLMYLRHDYNPAGTSSVLINGETLRVGGRSRGVEVREILADSVILRFEDREFRLRALNSWVNL